MLSVCTNVGAVKQIQMLTSYNINPLSPLQDQNWYDMKQAAKLLNTDMGRTKLFRFLREQGFLMEKNEPYQSYINEGFFKVISKDITGRKGQLLFKQMVTLISDSGIELIRQHLTSTPKN